MLSESDLTFLVGALTDPSPPVAAAAHRVLTLLQPLAFHTERVGEPSPDVAALDAEANPRVLPDHDAAISEAASRADRYLENDTQIGIGLREIESFRYLDQERASLLITVSFARCVDAAFSNDMGYAVGNDIGALLVAFSDRFIPDIPALIEIYLEMFPYAAEGRAKWYDTRDDSVVFFHGSGHLAVGWQIAWTVGRAGLMDVIAGIAPFTDFGESEETRVAALQLLEDTIRFLPISDFPQYAGVTSPEMNGDVIARSASISVASSALATGYKTVRVFYGTNRTTTGSTLPSRFYGLKDGDLELGECYVSIPEHHEIGTLESPLVPAFNWRSNPARYVVLMRLACFGEHEFRARLQTSVQESKDKEILVFVHGYRVSFEDAARRTAQLGADLDIATPVFFSWPSQGKFRRYGTDVTMAERSVPRLVEFLNLLADTSGATVIHLIAHSMGSLALSKAIVEYLGTHPGARPKFRELILAAPDIDAQIFREQIVPKITGHGSRLTVYASRRDYALLASRWLRSGLSRAGFVEHGTPLVVAGVETIDVSAVNSECLWGILQGHSYVGDRVAIIQDMSELLRSGRAAGERFGNASALLDGLPYWIMKPRSS